MWIIKSLIINIGRFINVIFYVKKNGVVKPLHL